MVLGSLLDVFFLVLIGNFNSSSIRLEVYGDRLTESFVLCGKGNIQDIFNVIVPGTVSIYDVVNENRPHSVQLRFRWKSASTPSISAKDTFFRSIIL